MNCRHCASVLTNVFVDLDFSPVSNAMLTSNQMNEPENYYPLKIFVCDNCFLVQVDEIQKADKIFNKEYTYFSSYSLSWLNHAKKYVDMMMQRFGFNQDSLIIEIASNDGYLLQYFTKHKISVLGIDPAANTALEAEKKGVKTLVDFFSSKLAEERLVKKGLNADLIIGNNVLAHVPDINDFVNGMKLALKSNGIITMEFPHLLQLVKECQFDTIYHEHFSYLSFYTVNRIFNNQGLELFDVEELQTHGGSLRIYAKNISDDSKEITKRVANLLDKEAKEGINSLKYYQRFQEKVDKIRRATLSFLIEQKNKGKMVIGYGAAAKGNTFLNYCGIKGTDLIKFVVDASPYKQNNYLPGSHIPVVGKEEIDRYNPDLIIILPWNLKDEISQQLEYVRNWGGQFVIFIPEVLVF